MFDAVGKKCIPEAAASGPHQAVLDEWVRLFTEKNGSRPDITGGRDGAIVKSLLQQHPLEEVLTLLRGFFRVGTKFSRERGAYTLPAFKSQYNDLLVMKQREEL